MLRFPGARHRRRDPVFKLFDKNSELEPDQKNGCQKQILNNFAIKLNILLYKFIYVAIFYFHNALADRNRVIL